MVVGVHVGLTSGVFRAHEKRVNLKNGIEVTQYNEVMNFGYMIQAGLQSMPELQSFLKEGFGAFLNIPSILIYY